MPYYCKIDDPIPDDSLIYSKIYNHSQYKPLFKEYNTDDAIPNNTISYYYTQTNLDIILKQSLCELNKEDLDAIDTYITNNADILLKQFLGNNFSINDIISYSEYKKCRQNNSTDKRTNISSWGYYYALSYIYIDILNKKFF